jgi:phosphotransferase system  glucose/maltose/N-acetylglucosamine-specific IIC component
MSCACQHNRLAVVRNPIRPFGRGEFERTGDFGRGTFERTGSFGGFWGTIGGIFQAILPAGLQIGTAIATQAIVGRGQPAPQAGQQSASQGPLTNAVTQTQADADAKTRERNLMLLALAAGGLALFFATRKRR